MAKARNARRKATIGHVEKLDGPTPEQIAKGGYVREDFIHGETAKGVTPHINRGGTPVMRWIDDGKLSDTQQRAIAHCLYLWHMCGLEQRVTANYGERIMGQGDSEARASNEIEARQDLHRIKDYVPASYFSVFENVVRFDEPAGVAGSKLGFGKHSACNRAHTVVCFVSDIIAMKERL